MIKCHEFGIQACGDIHADIMAIGMAPAKDEIENGRPFAGKSGKLLDALLAAAKITRESVYTTNLICWRTMDGKHNRDPYPQEIAACADRLALEINTIKPKLIVGLGDLVAKQFIDIRPFTRSALHRIKVYGHECWFMYTYHPAAALYESDKEKSDLKDDYHIINVIANDFLKLRDVVDLPPFPVPNFRVASFVEAQQLLDSLSTTGELANIDVETGHDEEDADDIFAHIGCLSITPLNHPDKSIIITEEVLKQLVFHENIRWITHYGLSDKQLLKNYGINITIHEDTCLMDFNVNENRLHRVKLCGHEYIGAPFYEDLMKPYKKNFLAAPPPVLHLYNTYDTVVSNGVFNYLRPKQDEEGTRHVYEKILIPAANVFADIQHRGIRVSKDNMKKLLVLWYNEVQELNKELDEMTDGINCNSPKQLAEYLTKQLGHWPGWPSTDKFAMRYLMDKHPLPAKLTRKKKLDKAINTYLIGFYDDIKEDGLLHPVILIHGAGTGRPSYINPPAQTMPGPNSREGGDEFGQIRSLFIPMDDDHILCEADYKSGEFYTAAAHSEDQNMLDDLVNTDFHLNTATILFEKPPEFITGSERSTGKTWNFRMFYALDAYGAASYFNKPIEVAKEWHKLFFDRYANFAAWRVNQKRRIQTEGFVDTFHGRKRHFPLIISYKQLKRAWRQAINDPIQADCVDNTLLSAIELHPILREYDSYILLEGHDALLFDLNKKYLDITIPIIKEVMEKSKHERMPRIPVDVKIGDNWYDMHEYKGELITA